MSTTVPQTPKLDLTEKTDEGKGKKKEKKGKGGRKGEERVRGGRVRTGDYQR